ncbi:MAG: DMT family transporter [Chloroflexi bacterium]|nr:DMT family transporter [Chloroflexota bacterium]
MIAEVVVARRLWWHGREKRLAEIAFILIVGVWGVSFVFTKNALTEIGPFAYNSLRMGIGAVCLAVMAGRQWRQVKWWWGVPVVLLGAILLGGYSLQSFGQQFTTASKAGFLTGINVVYVPLFAAVLLRRWPSRFQILGVVLAFVGLSLIAVEGDWRQLQFGRGDGYVAASGLFWALYVIVLSHSAQRMPILPFAALHVGTAALGSSLLWLWQEPQAIAWNAPNLWVGVLVTGVIILGVGTSVQAQLLRLVDPTRAALIATLEPLFAAGAGWLVGEVLTTAVLIGGTLILFGMVASELGQGSRGTGEKESKRVSDRLRD